jgi:hypothetical protein
LVSNRCGNPSSEPADFYNNMQISQAAISHKTGTRFTS